MVEDGRATQEDSLTVNRVFSERFASVPDRNAQVAQRSVAMDH